jgi:hypothetical protein
MDSNNNNNNNSNQNSNEIIIFCKFQISLLSLFLLTTFDKISLAFKDIENILNTFPSNFNYNNNSSNNNSPQNSPINNKNNTNNNNLKNNNREISQSNSDSLSTEEKSSDDILDNFKNIYKKKKQIGKYHWKVRAIKIIRYKIKQIIRQNKSPIITKYSGRSKVANLKPRLHGRFIKKNK